MSSALQTLIDHIAASADDKKAERITSYDVSSTNALTETVMIVSASNVIHCRSLVDDISKAIEEKVAELKSDDFFDEVRVSGDHNSGWVILDVNSIVVHCMTEPMREFYNLDAFFEKKGVVYHY
jgi:ribosome-associated protein